MFLSSWASYLDIKNGSRISDLSTLDPFAVFSFIILCLLAFLALFLLAFTSRLSAAEYWISTSVRRAPNSYMPAYKRHRLSLYSASSTSLRSRRDSSSQLSAHHQNARPSTVTPLTSHDDNGPRHEPELTFSPQEAISSFSGGCHSIHGYPDEEDLFLPRQPQ